MKYLHFHHSKVWYKQDNPLILDYTLQKYNNNEANPNVICV